MHCVKRGQYSSDQSQSSKWGLDYFSNYGPAEVATRWYSRLQMTWRSDLGNMAEWTRVPCLSLFPWDRPRPLRIPNQCLTDKQLKEKLKDLVHDSIRLYENCSIILFQATCESLCIYGLIRNKVLTVMSARRALHSLAFRETASAPFSAPSHCLHGYNSLPDSAVLKPDPDCAISHPWDIIRNLTEAPFSWTVKADDCSLLSLYFYMSSVNQLLRSIRMN